MRKLLLPFSLFYWFGVAVRNWFFDIGILKSKKVDMPVISVGNISTGGVGKTPFVELLLEKIVIDGQLSVVSRGYCRKSSGTVVVSDGHGNIASVEKAGDELSQLARKYPKLVIVADEKRVRGAEKAIELGAKLILLDDGFQHRYLQRDLNIVILTAEEVLDGDLLLPAGNRREPLASLKRADLIAITRCLDIEQFLSVCTVSKKRTSFPDKIPIVGLTTKVKEFKHCLSNELIKVGDVTGKNVIAFSGIGNPKSFEDLMMKENVNFIKHIVFSDHHWYKDNDIKKIIDMKKRTNAEFIITTEKDAARLSDRFTGFLKTEPVIVAEIKQEIISKDQKLYELLERAMNIKQV